METSNLTTEQYIEHEVKIRLLESHKDEMYKKFEKMDQRFEKFEAKFESRFTMLGGLIIASIVLPVFLHWLRLV